MWLKQQSLMSAGAEKEGEGQCAALVRHPSLVNPPSDEGGHRSSQGGLGWGGPHKPRPPQSTGQAAGPS